MILRLFSFLAFKLFYFIFSQICSRLLGLRLNELFVLDEGAGGSLSQSGSLSGTTYPSSYCPSCSSVGVNCLCKELKIVHEGWVSHCCCCVCICIHTPFSFPLIFF